jgi:DNA-directed RNA polymerase specialized sigma24 family protein
VTTISHVEFLSEPELLDRARSGDTAAWGALVDRYSPYVHAITVRAFRLGPREADDVFQDVFRRTYADLGALRPRDLRPSVARATRTLCLEHMHDRTVEPTTAVALLEIEAAMDVHDALGSLDDSSRQLLYRYFVLAEPYRTIAEALELPVGAVPGMVARSLDDLCEELSQ